MAKEIWLGPVLGNNRERLLERCAQYISQGRTDRLLYIAASHPLLDLVTDRLLDGRISRGVWGEFPVYLFHGFVRRVLSSARKFPATDLEATSFAGGADSTQRDRLKPDEAGETLPPRVMIDREELPLRRTLISQIIKQLADAGKLKAIRRLANRDGCVNTVASLIGELQRAAKTAEDFQAIVELRFAELHSHSQATTGKGRSSQLDFDREVALIYSAYTETLDRFGLSDEDADQLRALQILRGDLESRNVRVPWLKQIDLLVLDGFFDFTPVQGEMLKSLVPAAPNVIVNLNSDERNAEIFRPFESTIEHFMAMDHFEVRRSREEIVTTEAIAPLRARLFNAGAAAPPATVSTSETFPQGMPVLFECSDREVEIRSIIKETKALVHEHNYKLSDIAVVVRERAAYAEIILRVCADEHVPCNLDRRLAAQQVPALRACGKLFQLLRVANDDDFKNPKASDLAQLIKTGYFSLPLETLTGLTEKFDKQFFSLLQTEALGKHRSPSTAADSQKRLRSRLRVGRWMPDTIENVIAYVGSELRLNAWRDRARRLIDLFPSPQAAQSLISREDTDEIISTSDDEAAIEQLAKRKRPTPVHPAAIAWTGLILDHLRELITAVPFEATPEELRFGSMSLLEKLDFSERVRRPCKQANPSDIPHSILDVRGLESLRRAMAAAVRGFSYAHQVINKPAVVAATQTVPLSSFIDEVERAVRAQTLSIKSGNRDGLQVLEATDVRGLRFRALFIAGLNEGSFPLRTSRDWLYPPEERERLKKYGLILEDISTDTLLKEEHYFYQAACRATDRLYLTRPLNSDDGGETVASYYVEELQRAIGPSPIAAVQIRADVDSHGLEEISTGPELAIALVRQEQRRSHHGNRANLLAPQQIKKLASAAKSQGHLSAAVLRRVEIERERNSKHFGPHDGVITSNALKSLLSAHFGADYIHSASALSTYGNCAYRFFASRVLRLEPRSEAALDLQAIDAGKLLHDILKRFFEQYREKYLPAHNRDELRQQLAAIADQVFAEHENLVPPLNRRIWEIDCEIRKLILDQVLLHELRLQERTRERGLVPRYFELAFGRTSQGSDPDSSSQYLTIARHSNDAEIARLQGQIDRVDVDHRNRIAIAYDYKLSQGAKLEDIETGRQIQIPIYLAALEQLFLPSYELAGGGYYRLRGVGARLNQGLYRAALAGYTNVTSPKTKLDDVAWQRIRRAVRIKVWEFIDAMRRGDFSIKPSQGKATCKFCDFAAVCRYDQHRISYKIARQERLQSNVN